MRSIAASRVAGLALTALVLAGAAAAAPTFTVNSTVDAPGADTMGASLSDGVCETQHGNGICTLRAAIMESNHVPGGGATIVLPAGTYVIAIAPIGGGSEADGSFDVLAPMQIVGEGPSATIVDGGGLDSVFFVSATAVTMQGLAVRGGGGASAAIYNIGDLTLENVVASDNHGSATFGIYNGGTLALHHGIIERNGDDTLHQGGGGVLNDSSATASVQDSLISDNSGSGVSNRGDLTIERTSLLNNASSEGGGVFNEGSLVMTNDTLVGNRGEDAGGAISSHGLAQLVSVTIASNSTGSAASGAGIYRDPSGSVFLKNSIVFGNLADSSPDECSGDVLSGDYNVIGWRSTCTLTGATDHVNTSDVDPGLGDLLPNGGFSVDSFASDLSGPIPLASCTDPLGAPLATDGRGWERTFPPLLSPGCDAGANQSSARYAPPQLFGVELLRNGGVQGEELGEAARGRVTLSAPPYWVQDRGAVSQVLYGSDADGPTRGDAPGGSGSYFFAGGTSSESRSYQLIDLIPLAHQIDAGQIRYRLSGAFGGFQDEDDSATLSLIFSDDLEIIGIVGVGGFKAADRGSVTKLLPDSKSGIVPPTTRSVEVVLDMIRVTPITNDGYADDLSLVLPEPSSSAEGALALAALAGLALRGAPRAHRHRPPRLR